MSRTLWCTSGVDTQDNRGADSGGRRKTILSIVRNSGHGRLLPAPSRVMDGFEVHIQFLDHLKRLNA